LPERAESLGIFHLLGRPEVLQYNFSPLLWGLTAIIEG
jgi:hypothetical protein